MTPLPVSQYGCVGHAVRVASLQTLPLSRQIAFLNCTCHVTCVCVTTGILIRRSSPGKATDVELCCCAGARKAESSYGAQPVSARGRQTSMGRSAITLCQSCCVCLLFVCVPLCCPSFCRTVCLPVGLLLCLPIHVCLPACLPLPHLFGTELLKKHAHASG